MAELKKSVGFFTILALAIGTILGTSLFFGAATGARFAGNAVLLSWVLLSIVAFYVSACFGELVSMFPKSGGVYEFCKQTYGRFVSFMIGWIAWLVGTITTVLLVVAAVNYLIPGSEAWLLKLGISLFFIIMLNFIAYLGMEASSATLISFAVITVSIILLVIMRGIGYASVSNLLPFFTHTPLAIFVVLFFIIESYFGWESATYLAEETMNAEKVIPKALMVATGIVALLGLFFYSIQLMVIPWQELMHSVAPLTDLSRIIFINENLRNVVSIGVYLIMLGSAAGGIIAIPRLLLALARDKLFLGQFKHVNERFNTPDKAIIFQSIILIIILLIASGNYTMLLSLLVPTGIIMYVFVLLSVTILRFKRPDIKRTFKVPFGKVGPVIVSAFFVSIIVFWVLNVKGSADLLALSGSFILMGVPLYLLVSLYYDPKMITSVNDVSAYFQSWTDFITSPKRMHNEILRLLGPANEKRVLEIGCGVGSLTLKLLEAVGPHGMVISTDFSKNKIKIAKRRVTLKKWVTEERIYGSAYFIHDTEQLSRLHPSITYVDGAVSIGTLSYLQEPKKILQELRKRMPAGGKICFVEYSDYFHLLPNVEWLSKNKDIEKLFRNCGFSVRVERKKGLLWNYIFIYGMKFGKSVAFI